MIGKVSIPNPPSPIGPRASGEQTGTRNRGVNPQTSSYKPPNLVQIRERIINKVFLFVRCGPVECTVLEH